MKQVKVPSSIQEAFAEATALRALAEQMNNSWWFSPKALVYQMKSDKIRLLAWRALKTSTPAIDSGWTYDPLTGMVRPMAAFAPDEPKVKKPRAPRVKKVAEPAPEVAK